MKYLKSYKTFEALQIDTGDQPDEKRLKERVNLTEKQIKEYKEKKPKIDQLYSITKNPVEIESELKKLMPDEKNPNPFVTDYLRICRLQKEVEDGRKTTVEDKIKLDDFSQEQKFTTNKEDIATIGAKVSQIKDRMNTTNILTADKAQELKKIMTEHKDKMIKIEKELIEAKKKLLKKK